MSPGEFVQWRHTLRLSQAGAAAALGLSRRMVQYYEVGRPIPQTVALACWTALHGERVSPLRQRRRRRKPTTEPMTFAYADPPYLGQGKKHYGCHHDAAADFDDLNTHRALIDRLCDEFPDGWALSASSASMPALLPLCPPGVRVCAWVKPFASFKPNVGIAYAWEPVLLWGGRSRSRADPTVRDWLAENITLRKGLPGAKPERFCFWLFNLLNAAHDDQVVDLFPGTGAISSAWTTWCRKSALRRLEIGGGQGVRLQSPAKPLRPPRRSRAPRGAGRVSS